MEVYNGGLESLQVLHSVTAKGERPTKSPRSGHPGPGGKVYAVANFGRGYSMMDPNNEVMVAFEILLEEIETVVAGFNEEGANAFRNSDYETAKEIMERAGQITAFRDRVKELQKEWERLFAKRVTETLKKKAQPVTLAQRLQRGLRTPEAAFRLPILEALVELGGSASISEVLNRVYEKMKNQLNEYDYQPLPSTPNELRWRNTAQWCRATMVKEGLLTPDSPRGIWEITEAGRTELTRLKQADEEAN